MSDFVIDLQKVIAQMQLKVRTVGVRRSRVRLAIGCALFRVGARITGMGIDLDIAAKSDKPTTQRNQRAQRAPMRS